MNQLILGNTQQVLAVLEPQSINLAYIDIPSELIIPSLIQGNETAEKKYKKWLKSTLKKSLPLLKDTASIFVNVPTFLKDWVLEKACLPHFKKKNYRGEIKWQSPHAEGNLSVNSSLQHSTMLYFTVSKNFTYNHPLLTEKPVFPKESSFIYRSKTPYNLLKRIIQYTSNEGDTFLNIGVRNGKVLRMADQQKRFWVGVDDSLKSIKATEYQLNKENSYPFSVRIYEYEPYTRLYGETDGFEQWVKSQFEDQLMPEASVILKCNEKAGLLTIDQMVENHIQPLRKKWFELTDQTEEKDKSPEESQEEKQEENNRKNKEKLHGVLIAESFSKYAFEEVKRLQTYENIHLKLITLEELVPIPQKPEIQFNLSELWTGNKQEVCFDLQTSETESIAFYSWDLDYNPIDPVFRPQIMFQETPQLIHDFAPGAYTIAVQTTQKDGLSSLQTLQLEIANTTIEEKIAS